MLFGWHDAKHRRNQAERGIGCDTAALIFAGRVLLRTDDRRDDREMRVQAIGEADGVMLMVVFTDRAEVRWIISARQANRKEWAAWRA